jgi:mono/diheme cytochrome c family protein
MDDTVVPPAAPVTVTSLSPMPNEVVSTPPANIVAGFSRELNQASVGPTTFLLTASGGDGTFGELNDVPITAAAIIVGANPNSATFDLGGQQLADDTYRVSLLGNATASILDLDGNMLDGEYLGRFPTGDLAAGGDFVVQFTVPITIGPTLRQIQAVVFTPKCASCHNGVGANLPGVMNLTSEVASRAALVNVLSIQSALDRVEPFQPANSYLVHKIDGTAASQMPPTGPLPAEEVAAIVQWITDGAP